ncbi:MAG: hypothetical protein R3C99_06930 [Pirellulaceae bacterium]
MRRVSTDWVLYFSRSLRFRDAEERTTAIGKLFGENVILKGSPLDLRTIQFTLKSGSTFGAAEIKNGEYEIPVEGGLSPGVMKCE